MFLKKVITIEKGEGKRKNEGVFKNKKNPMFLRRVKRESTWDFLCDSKRPKVYSTNALIFGNTFRAVL